MLAKFRFNVRISGHLKALRLTTVEWVGFKLTFPEKDICHDHEIDILRSLAKLQLRYV